MMMISWFLHMILGPIFRIGTEFIGLTQEEVHVQDAHASEHRTDGV
jgi:hypothetical protein